jgi:hypothetical protein
MLGNGAAIGTVAITIRCPPIIRKAKKRVQVKYLEVVRGIGTLRFVEMQTVDTQIPKI